MDTATRRAEVARLYAERVPRPEIAARLGVSMNVVKRCAERLRQRGVTLPKLPSSAVVPAGAAVATFDHARARRMAREGMTYLAIALALGTTEAAVVACVKRGRASGRDITPPRIVPVPLPRGCRNPRYRRACKAGLNREEAIAFARDESAVLPAREPKKVARQKAKAPEPKTAPRLAAPRRRPDLSMPLVEAVKSLGGMRPCMNCRKPFKSPDKSRVRLCAPCKSSNADSLPHGW